MTLWWIGNVVLLVVVLPVVVYLLHGVLSAARSIVPSVQADREDGGCGVEGPRRGRAAADDAGPGDPDRRGRRELRRLPRRDPRRRPERIGRRCSQSQQRRSHDRRRRADRPRPRLLPRLGDRRSCERSPPASTRSSPTSARSCEKSAPVNGVVTAINEQLDAGVDLLEGLLVKKAGMTDAVGLVEGLYAGAAAAGFRSFPESTTIKAPRIGEVYTQGTLTLARLGREAPIAVGNPHGPVLRNVERREPAARLLYPDVARQARLAARSPVIGTEPRAVPAERAARRDHAGRGGGPREGPVGRAAAEGIVPAELGGSDAPRQMLAEDPQLGARPGRDDRIRRACDRERVDPSGGDQADATSDGGPDCQRERARPEGRHGASQGDT